ncbi:hypothetical protein Taro_035516 [Colocasia esculenta]|uniref:Protein TAPETUM DETERMINANT 1 n=1 Tax=Colocasia esculenta TaxID=4460 RepID=A0A843W0N7_COLES|nr:hypothetical protein [Colocasia esculenta]
MTVGRHRSLFALCDGRDNATYPCHTIPFAIHPLPSPTVQIDAAGGWGVEAVQGSNRVSSPRADDEKRLLPFPSLFSLSLSLPLTSSLAPTLARGHPPRPIRPFAISGRSGVVHPDHPSARPYSFAERIWRIFCYCAVAAAMAVSPRQRVPLASAAHLMVVLVVFLVVSEAAGSLVKPLARCPTVTTATFFHSHSLSKTRRDETLSYDIVHSLLPLLLRLDATVSSRREHSFFTPISSGSTLPSPGERRTEQLQTTQPTKNNCAYEDLRNSHSSSLSAGSSERIGVPGAFPAAGPVRVGRRTRAFTTSLRHRKLLQQEYPGSNLFLLRSLPHQSREAESVAGGDGVDGWKELQEDINRMGDGDCGKDDIVVYQAASSPLPNGIPTYSVQVINTCLGVGCGHGISRIHLNCGWFSSARLINPKVFRRLRFNDCLVNDGGAIPAGAAVSFQYANSYPYKLAVSSVSCLPRGSR